MKVQIIGYGVVGKAQEFLMKQLGRRVTAHDPFILPKSKIQQKVDVTFICTSEEAVEDVIANLCSLQVEGYEWLREYVAEKLRKSEVIPEDRIPELVYKIVHEAHRCGSHKTWNHYEKGDDGKFRLVEGTFACIEQADREIEWAIKYPPEPIDDKHFSLNLF